MPHALKYYICGIQSPLSYQPGPWAEHKAFNFTDKNKHLFHYFNATCPWGQGWGAHYAPLLYICVNPSQFEGERVEKNLTFPIISLAKGRTFRWLAKTPCSIPFGVGLLLVWLWSGTISGPKQSIARIANAAQVTL